MVNLEGLFLTNISLGLQLDFVFSGRFRTALTMNLTYSSLLVMETFGMQFVMVSFSMDPKPSNVRLNVTLWEHKNERERQPNAPRLKLSCLVAGSLERQKLRFTLIAGTGNRRQRRTHKVRTWRGGCLHEGPKRKLSSGGNCDTGGKKAYYVI